MADLSIKPSLRVYGLVAKLSVLTNMHHEPDLYADRSCTMVCPRTWGHNS